MQRYLEITEQVLGAAASLAMLSSVARSGVDIAIDEKVEIDVNALIRALMALSSNSN
ncbi:MAG: hypothetical protein RM368_04755 [Nostoc sp. DedSLP03]|uniref:hypothetical protein n=1 Tax=Nostoc sp. DedSLP03 TaxID=3075400 RepID=UPI002AD2BC07|nr:hypothetical protein [Nostoc sp. DedSLP03]MDZ7964271.1 hypothetical protein [Nostoc sp. DedSLP03]